MPQITSENQRVQEKNQEAKRQAYQAMRSVLDDRADYDGLNAVLRFLGEKGRVDPRLPLAQQLRHIEAAFAIQTRYIKLDADWYRTAAIPMLVKTIQGGWVAVIPKSDGRCQWVERGRATVVTGKNAARFTGDAMCFYKGWKRGAVSLRALVGSLLRCVSGGDWAWALAAAVLTTLAGMLLPWVNSFFFTYVVPSGQSSEIPAAAALLLSAVMAAGLLRLLQSLILTNSMLRASTHMQSAIFSRLLSLRPEFFRAARSGELSRIVMECSDLTRVLSARGVGACLGLALSLGYLIQIGLYAPPLLLPVLLVSALSGALTVAEGILESRWSRTYSRSLSQMSGFCYELFSGMEQVKLSGAEERVMRRWSEGYYKTAQAANKPLLLRYAAVLRRLIQVFATAAVFLLGAGLSAADFIAFSAAYGAYTAATAGAAVVVGMASGVRASYALLQDVLTAPCEEYGPDKKRPERFEGEIDLTDLTFRYPSDPNYVLKGLTTHIRAGESVGITGPSGCGKSTLIRLLLGFESPEEGSVYLDGFDLRELDLKNYRRKLGTVLQDAKLISGDLYSNITVTKPDATLQEVTDAVELAGLAEDVAALPMGLHTFVDPENCTLSGGQRQRVLIARALIARPTILIFDEATSALDNVTQAKIMEGVNTLPCTKLIVAHRLSTLARCDRVLVMDRGAIVQEGRPEELIQVDGPLRRLMERQMIPTQESEVMVK